MSRVESDQKQSEILNKKSVFIMRLNNTIGLHQNRYQAISTVHILLQVQYHRLRCQCQQTKNNGKYCWTIFFAGLNITDNIFTDLIIHAKAPSEKVMSVMSMSDKVGSYQTEGI